MDAIDGLQEHPHAAAVLGSALRDGNPSHAYLLHGPAGVGKRVVARRFAAELLAEGSSNPDGARARAMSGAHPDLTWVAPSGAHEMLRRDVEDAVVGAAGHTPFESDRRVFVLERVDTMNDEAANSLLKTLEEPASYVVLLLISDRPSQVMPTIFSRCQPVRFNPLPEAAVVARLVGSGVEQGAARACARLAQGDGERATALAVGADAPLRGLAEAFARSPLAGTVARDRPWTAVLAHAGAAAAAVEGALQAELEAELQTLARTEKRKRQTEYADRIKRAKRRAQTVTLDEALGLVGLWYRDLRCVAVGAPELAFNADRVEALAADADGRAPAALNRALELVEDTRARLSLNVSEELACEALGLRLEAALAR